MKNRSVNRSQLLLLVILAVLSSGANAEVAPFTIIPAQNLESVTTSSRGVSADGAVVAGVEDGAVWRWTRAGGTEYLGAADVYNVWWSDVSADGSTIVARHDDGTGLYTAALYSDATGWTNLGGLEAGESSTGYSVNGDGSIAVGLAWEGGAAEAYIWTEAGGMVGLGRPATANSRANDISADSLVIVGWYEHETTGCRRPARWTPEGSVDLFLGADICGEAHAVSSDGSIIVGQAFVPGNNYYTAFRYHDETGWTDLGRLTSGETDGALATGIADNGTIAGLYGNEAQGVWAGFMWTQADGMVPFAEVLTGLGVDLSEWWIAEARDISADGTTIVGTALVIPTLYLRGFVATIPAPVFVDGFEFGDTSPWSTTVKSPSLK